MFRILFLLAGLFGFSSILAGMIDQGTDLPWSVPAWLVALPIVGLFLASEYFSQRPSAKFTLIMGGVGLVALALVPLVWYEAIETLAGKNEIPAARANPD